MPHVKECQIARSFLLRNENVEFLNCWKIFTRKSESSKVQPFFTAEPRLLRYLTMQKAEKPKMAKYVRNLLRNGVKASRPSTLIVTDV